MFFIFYHFIIDNIFELINLRSNIIVISAEPLKCFSSSFLIPFPHQPNWRLGQPPAEEEEHDAREAEGEVEILDRDHEANAETEQPAAVTVKGVEAGQVTSVGDQADLREERVAGDLHHAREQVGEGHRRQQRGEGGAEVRGAGGCNLENA